jgi:hypothetical protein
MAVMAPSAQFMGLDNYLAELTDVLYVGYSGTLTQWLAFLSSPELRPRAFDQMSLKVDDRQVSLGTPRLSLQIPLALAGFSAGSELTVDMTYLMEGGKLNWDIGALYLYKDLGEQTYIGLRRHVRPTDESAHELLTTWDEMRAHGRGFNRLAGHDGDFKSYWIHDSVSAPMVTGPGLDPEAKVLYDVFYNTTTSSYPQDLEETERQLIHGTHILER